MKRSLFPHVSEVEKLGRRPARVDFCLFLCVLLAAAVCVCVFSGVCVCGTVSGFCVGACSLFVFLVFVLLSACPESWVPVQ
jgi:hypothetical protein